MLQVQNGRSRSGHFVLQFIISQRATEVQILRSPKEASLEKQ